MPSTPCLILPNLGDYVHANYNAALDVVTGDFTFEAWIYAEQHDDSAGILFRGTTGSIAFHLGFFGGGNDRIGIGLNNNIFYLQGDPLPLNSWIHVATTRSGSDVRLFTNGIIVASGTYADPIVYAGEGFDVGLFLNATRTFSGRISEARVSNIARYTASFSPPAFFSNDANTIVYWKLNEGTGTAANDSSSNNIDGTLQSTATWSTRQYSGSVAAREARRRRSGGKC
jgi:hypothetical protein